MIRYLAARPKLLTEICYIGVLLLVASAFIASSGTIPGAQAFACTGGVPSVPAGASYATTWNINSWLLFDNVPIGPSGWSVSGHNKTASGDICFSENWKLTKVVFAETRDNLEGMILAPDGSGNATTDSSTSGSHILHFNGPVSTYPKTVTIPPTGCFFGVCKTPARTITYDQEQIFDSASNGSWIPVGSYGLLRNSSGNLNESRSYMPKEWQISGTF